MYTTRDVASFGFVRRRKTPFTGKKARTARQIKKKKVASIDFDGERPVNVRAPAYACGLNGTFRSLAACCARLGRSVLATSSVKSACPGAEGRSAGPPFLHELLACVAGWEGACTLKFAKSRGTKKGNNKILGR